MKKLSKIKLSSFENTLDDNKLKLIIGGYVSPTHSCYTKCKSTDCGSDKPNCERIGSSADCQCQANIG